MKISIHNQTNEDIKVYQLLLKSIFKHIKEQKNMHIIFITTDEMKRLNQLYRQKNQTTDVLSFPNDEKDDDSLGDIFINLEKACDQAQTYEHSTQREVGFLAVHGYLHLIGFDHQTQEEEAFMIEKQNEILEKVNLKRSQ